MKVLIVRIGAMGDVLHALPAVAALRAAQPGWQLDWVVDTRWSPLLADSGGQGPVVHRVHLADTKLWSRAPFSLATYRSIRQLRSQLRTQRYDIAIDMQGTLRSAVIARFSGAPLRVGYSDPREPQAAWFYNRRFPRRAAHVVEQGLELLTQALKLNLSTAPGAPGPGSPASASARWGGDPDSRTRDLSGPDLKPAGAPFVTASSSRVGSADFPDPNPLPHEPWADNWAAEETRSSRLALLAPGAGWAAKQWPIDRFAALARELRAHGFDVVTAAPRQDNETALRLVAASAGSVRMLVCNVAGLLALTRRAALLVGGDSGPTHLAAALGIPLVALFGPTDPGRNGPWGPGARRVLRDPASITSYRHTAAPDPGLARIPVAQVLQAALEVTAIAPGTQNPEPRTWNLEPRT